MGGAEGAVGGRVGAPTRGTPIYAAKRSQKLEASGSSEGCNVVAENAGSG